MTSHRQLSAHTCARRPKDRSLRRPVGDAHCAKLFWAQMWVTSASYFVSALSNRRCSSSFCKTFHSSHGFIEFRPIAKLTCSARIHVAQWIDGLYVCFWQRVSIACYAERCLSHDRFCPSDRLTVRLSQSGIIPKRLQLRPCGLHWG